MQSLPKHLSKYIVDQNYDRYTPIDQAVWRYILRQLKRFLAENADESYIEGLELTGIEIEQIPRISDISKKLEKFGWRALPVSGFIPPAAFMELQSLSVLPIASDMRSLDHLRYTPAPDIVHEAAGHAPILAHAPYAKYLRQYAQVAKKSILSKQDLAQYEAIRNLSDIKENPESSAEDIKAAEEQLKEVTQNINFVSEAAELARMNWWTAEYGLIKKKDRTKIFGAGLLSSIGEAKWCLSDQVKKIPLTAACVKQAYDITEPQPQLFVTDSFEHLEQVLEDFAKTMAFRQGGVTALKKLVQAETVNSVEFENGIQISGVLNRYLADDASDKAIYLQFSGPVQLCFQDQEISGHGRNYHTEGYGTPIGVFTSSVEIGNKSLNKPIILNYSSGVVVKGVLKSVTELGSNKKAHVISLSQATCQFKENTLFRPEWGDFDIITGIEVAAGFGGPADRLAYGGFDDFAASRVTVPPPSPALSEIFQIYRQVREFRNSKSREQELFQQIFLLASQKASDHWLIFVELFEISVANDFDVEFRKIIQFHLEKLKRHNPALKDLIEDGLSLALIGDRADSTTLAGKSYVSEGN